MDVGTAFFVPQGWRRGNQFNLRTDYELRPRKDRLYGNFSRTNSYAVTGGIRPAFDRPAPNTTHFGNINYARTFSSSKLNEFRAGVMRLVGLPDVPDAQGFGRDPARCLQRAQPGQSFGSKHGSEQQQLREVDVPAESARVPDRRAPALLTSRGDRLGRCAADLIAGEVSRWMRLEGGRVGAGPIARSGCPGAGARPGEPAGAIDALTAGSS